MLRLIVVFALLAIQSLAPPASAQTVLVRAGKLVDVVHGGVRTDQLIRIRNGRIASISRYTPQPADTPVIDWSGYAVLPGLIDLHTHLVGPIQSASSADILTSSADNDQALGRAHALATLRAGFTTVRDVGTYRGFADVTLRDTIDAGLAPGPRMAVAGAYITLPGGGGEVTGLGDIHRLPADMRRGVVHPGGNAGEVGKRLLDGGADFLKLMATGAVLTEGTEPGAVELSERQMRGAVRVARKRGSYATAHAHGARGIRNAVRAGVRSIEHGSLADTRTLRLMKKHGVWLVADIYNGDYIDAIGTRDGWPAETLRKNRETTQTQRDAFRKAVGMGVRIGYGTDAGVFPHGLNARQFPIMVQYGMTPMQAIQSATVHAAELMGWSQEVGAILPGRYADLIAVAGDPLADITLLSDVKAVMKGGIQVTP